jgi:predicted TPR repeat methyltransferase
MESTSGHAFMNRAQRRSISKSKSSTDLVGLAEFYLLNGRLDDAEQKFREAIKLNPGHAQAHNNLGSILQKTGRIAEATEHYARAFKISPMDTAFVFNLAWALTVQHRFRDAVALYRQAISLDPQSADAHFGLALALTDLGEYGEAELHYLSTLQIDPLHWQARVSFGMALVDQEKIIAAFEQAEILARSEQATGFPHKNFGVLLARAGCPDGARLCFETHLAHNPADKDEIAMLLATVGGALPERTSDQQVVQLYAARASRWDQAIAGPMGYQGHRLVFAAIDRLNSHAGTIIDAGCGTGLVGELVRAKTDRLIGVDMSEAMLTQARQKDVYDELHCGDLVEYLNKHPRSCDIISSAATLIHLGDLNPVFAAVARCLRPDGLFVFTVFPNDDDPEAVSIGTLNGMAQGGCFRHGSSYVTRTAAMHGLCVELLKRELHEHARNASIYGLVVALRLREPADLGL